MENTKAMRITKVQRFADIKAMLHGETPQFGTTIEDAETFIDHEVALLSKKNNSSAKRTAANQTANDAYKELIVDFMMARQNEDGTPDDSGMTCTAIGQSIPALVDAGFGTSKFSSLCNSLVDDGKFIKKSVKGKSLFFLA